VLHHRKGMYARGRVFSPGLPWAGFARGPGNGS
jgi:hypothetical protein